MRNAAMSDTTDLARVCEALLEERDKAKGDLVSTQKRLEAMVEQRERIKKEEGGLGLEEFLKKALERFDEEVGLRKPRWHHGHPSQPRYGTKIRNGREELHKGEQLVIDKIHQLRTQGKSLRWIAHLLTEDGVLTKCRGKKWHPEMVSRILKTTGGEVAREVDAKADLNKPLR